MDTRSPRFRVSVDSNFNEATVAYAAASTPPPTLRFCMTRGFNEATAVPLRTHKRPDAFRTDRDELQWGRSDNAADTASKRPALRSLVSFNEVRTGNAADTPAAASPRRINFKLQRSRGDDAADIRWSSTARTTLHSFNEATAVTPRIHCSNSPTVRRYRCFNEATAITLRIQGSRPDGRNHNGASTRAQ